MEVSHLAARCLWASSGEGTEVTHLKIQMEDLVTIVPPVLLPPPQTTTLGRLRIEYEIWVTGRSFFYCLNQSKTRDLLVVVFRV